MRIREEIEELGYRGGKTILDDLLRELRPRYLPPPRTFQRTRLPPRRAGCSSTSASRGREIPVGHGQTRRGYVVTCELPYSRAFAGALVFSKEFADIAWGMSRCLARLGALPQKLVWDREGAIAPAAAARPRPSLAFCGQLALGWVILDAGDCQAKGALERSHRFVARQLRGRPALRQPARLPGPARRLVRADQRARAPHHARGRLPSASPRSASGCGRCPSALPDTDRRFVMRVPPQPYLRFDRNDYSLDPRLVGRRVEVRVSQTEITAVALDTRRARLPPPRASSPAASPSPTPPTSARSSELRGERKRRRREPEVELRPLARYDALIPA